MGRAHPTRSLPRLCHGCQPCEGISPGAPPWPLPWPRKCALGPQIEALSSLVKPCRPTRLRWRLSAARFAPPKRVRSTLRSTRWRQGKRCAELPDALPTSAEAEPLRSSAGGQRRARPRIWRTLATRTRSWVSGGAAPATLPGARSATPAPKRFAQHGLCPAACFRSLPRCRSCRSLTLPSARSAVLLCRTRAADAAIRSPRLSTARSSPSWCRSPCPLAAAAGAAGRCAAAWSCKAALTAAAAARRGYHRAAWARRPRVLRRLRVFVPRCVCHSVTQCV